MYQKKQKRNHRKTLFYTIVEHRKTSTQEAPKSWAVDQNLTVHPGLQVTIS